MYALMRQGFYLIGLILPVISGYRSSGETETNGCKWRYFL
jgi:hypothetical protein